MTSLRLHQDKLQQLTLLLIFRVLQLLEHHSYMISLKLVSQQSHQIKKRIKCWNFSNNIQNGNIRTVGVITARGGLVLNDSTDRSSGGGLIVGTAATIYRNEW